MEKYISKINNRVISKHDEKGQHKIKLIFLSVGGSVLGLGLAGFLSALITFAVLFADGKTDDCMIAWILAVIFLVVFVAGCVVTRIGDKLLTEGYNESVEKGKKEER